MQNKFSPSYDDGLLKKGKLYTVGTNDGVQFKRIEFVGTKLLNGKTIMVFVSPDNKQITINPSFHTFTMEDEDFLIMNEVENEAVNSIVNEAVLQKKKESEIKWEN
jgi:hypothetical protein